MNPVNLIKAIKNDEVDKVILVLSKNYENVNYVDKNGKTLLIYSIEEGHFDIVRCLIDNGAFIELPDFEKHTPLMYASSFDKNLPKQYQNSHLKILKLLLSRGANINKKCIKNETALDKAIKCNLEEVVRLLVKYDGKLASKLSKF